jgi:hypothetical protein
MMKMMTWRLRLLMLLRRRLIPFHRVHHGLGYFEGKLFQLPAGFLSRGLTDPLLNDLFLFLLTKALNGGLAQLRIGVVIRVVSF